MIFVQIHIFVNIQVSLQVKDKGRPHEHEKTNGLKHVIWING